MIQQWGLATLQSGEGVMDVAGDPGFMAVELLRSGIPVTVVDPAFGFSGKQDPLTSQFLCQFDQRYLRVIREPFNQAFVDNHGNLVRGISALVALYPDEATDFCLYFTAFRSMRTAIIPCNECKQYFPPHNPTYEGFVQQCLMVDYNYSRYFGNTALMKREQICNTPYCQVILQRTPMPQMPASSAPGAQFQPSSAACTSPQTAYPRGDADMGGAPLSPANLGGAPFLNNGSGDLGNAAVTTGQPQPMR